MYALPMMSGHAPDEPTDGVLGISTQTRIRGSVSSWTVWGSTWCCQMHRYITFHRNWIVIRSGEREGQSMASMPSSSRNCLHTQVNEVGQCPAPGGTHGKGKQQSGCSWLWHRGLCDPQRVSLSRPSLTHSQTGHTGWCYRQHNIHHSVSGLFHACHMCYVLTCSDLWRKQCANVLVSSCKCQSSCTVLGCEHRSH